MPNIIPKKYRQAVYRRSECRCEICGSTKGCQIHHIVKRRHRIHTPENLILLCWDCHHGTYGVHGKYGKQLDLKLKKRLQQRYFMQGKSEEEVRKLMGGKLYGFKPEGIGTRIVEAQK